MMAEQAVPAEPQLAAQWARVRGRLQQEVGDVEYRTWLRQMTLVGLHGDEITVTLPSRFLRDWVRSHYGDRLSTLWQAENRRVRRVELRFGGLTLVGSQPPAEEAANGPALAESASPPAPVAEVARGEVARGEAGRGEERAERAVDGGLLDPRFSFDSFVVGKPNEFAYACARRVADAPASHGFNPLFLYGGVGLGKTHLMNAIAWDLTDSARPGGPVSVAYMSAEKFMYRFIAAIRSKSTMEFKEELRSVDVLMIDDLQFLIGKDTTQEEFFHTFNALFESKQQIILTCDRYPKEVDKLEPRLKSRLGWGLSVAIEPPDFETRAAILLSKAQDKGVAVDEHVAMLLAKRIRSNVRDLEGALNTLAARANFYGKPITTDFAEETLRDLLATHAQAVTVPNIQKITAEYFNVRLQDLLSKRRVRSLARPRQIAMALSKELTDHSLPEIGEAFGGRDHTTVLHACRTIKKLCEADARMRQDWEQLIRTLTG